MLKFNMRLQPKYFKEIKLGRKLIEIRLNDKKRQNIKSGDLINFSSTKNNEDKITVKVLDVKKYNNAEKLVSAYDLHLFGDIWKNKEEAIKAIDFYSNEDIEKYGLLAIEITVDI